MLVHVRVSRCEIRPYSVPLAQVSYYSTRPLVLTTERLRSLVHVISFQRAFLLDKVQHCIRAARQTVSRTAGAQRPISTSLHPNCHRPLTPVFCHRPSFVPSSSLVDHHHTPRRSFHQHQPTQLTPVTRYCHRRDETRHAVSRARRCDCGRCRQWLHCQRQRWVSPGCFLVTSVSPAFLDRSRAHAYQVGIWNLERRTRPHHHLHCVFYYQLHLLNLHPPETLFTSSAIDRSAQYTLSHYSTWISCRPSSATHFALASRIQRPLDEEVRERASTRPAALLWNPARSSPRLSIEHA